MWNRIVSVLAAASLIIVGGCGSGIAAITSETFLSAGSFPISRSLEETESCPEENLETDSDSESESELESNSIGHPIIFTIGKSWKTFSSSSPFLKRIILDSSLITLGYIPAFTKVTQSFLSNQPFTFFLITTLDTPRGPPAPGPLYFLS